MNPGLAIPASTVGARPTSRRRPVRQPIDDRRPASVSQVGDPRARAAASVRQRTRAARYRYRLADLDELFADAEASADPGLEARRDKAGRRTNVRVVGVVFAVAVGLAILAAGMVDHIVMLVLNLFSAT